MTDQRYRGPLRRRDDPPEGEVGALTEGAYNGGWSDRRGGGPRAHRLSDESLQEEICELLTHHPDLDAAQIEVLVEGGEVTLQGSVENRDVRWGIEELVASVSGVGLVHNRLRVVDR
jgi:osmotically-inducible protein OsmY